jgi:hypothetical protein
MSSYLTTTGTASPPSWTTLNTAALCSFLAYLGTTDTNSTGDGTQYTLGSVNALTKVYDLGSNLNTNGTFTAPYTGTYIFSGSVQISGMGVAHTTAIMSFLHGSVNYYSNQVNPFVVMTGSSNTSLVYSYPIKCTANDTVVMQIYVAGSTKTVSVDAGLATVLTTMFSGVFIG